MPSNTEDEEEKSGVLGMAPTKKGGAGRDSEEQAATEARTSEGKDPTGREVGRGAASPADILEHLTTMTVGLEKAWSEALASEGASKAVLEARGVWNSFVATHHRWTERFVELWRRCGLDEIVIEEFPLGDGGLSRLGRTPRDAAERFYRLQIATMYVFVDLVDALKGLQEPSGTRVSIPPGGPVESWWEGGAFALIRRRAAALAGLLRESEVCLEEVALASGAEYTPLGSERVTRTWEKPLCAASGLVEQGWHEATLPQLLAAIRAVLAEVQSVDAAALPVPLAPPSQGIESLSSIAPHLPLLQACCDRIGKGLPVAPGVAVPIAKELITYQDPWHGWSGRWRRTARSPSPRSGRRRALCQSSTSRATRVCPSPRARGRWTRRGSWWRAAPRWSRPPRGSRRGVRAEGAVGTP
jgi:hypothetical protein